DIRDATLGIDGEFVPIDAAAGTHPEIFRPRIETEFTGPRNGMKHPREFAGSGVIGVDVPRQIGVITATAHQGHDDEILEDAAGVISLDWSGIAPIAVVETDAHVNAPVVAEGSDGFAGARVNGGQKSAVHRVQATIGAFR